MCTENICRSPMAEWLLRHHLKIARLDRGVKVRSAGTRTSQPGVRPDRRAEKVIRAAGIKVDRIRSSRISEKDLVNSDFIFAMDQSNVRDLRKLCPPEHQHKISLLLSHLPDESLQDVPDPYYGSVEGFYEVLQLIDSAVAIIVPYMGHRT